MLKRYFVPNLIGVDKRQRYFITLISLLILIVGSQNISAQQQIALDAYAILERSCFNCHGPTGSFRDALLIEHSDTHRRQKLLYPGNPDTSELYNRLITTDVSPNGCRTICPLYPLKQLTRFGTGYWPGRPDWTATTYNRWRLHLSG